MLSIRLLIFILLFSNISLYANTIYYQHKISQFHVLSCSQKNIAMIGDSITDRGLWSELTNRNDIVNRGINGDTTEGVLNRIDTLNKNLKQIFIMIGINDLLKGQSVDYVFNNYKIIIESLKKKNIQPVIQSTLYIGENAPSFYNQKVKLLNGLLEKYTTQNAMQYIDLNKQLALRGVLSNEYSLDGLHLNGKGYIEWEKIISKYFYPIVKQ